MKKHFKIYNYGYEDGMMCAFDDLIKNKKRTFKKIDKDVLSKIYDIGYIDGYNRFYYVMKNHLSFKNKI